MGKTIGTRSRTVSREAITKGERAGQMGRVQPQHRRFLNGGFRLWPTTPFQLFKPLISNRFDITLSLEKHQYFISITAQILVQVLNNKASTKALGNEASTKASIGSFA